MFRTTLFAIALTVLSTASFADEFSFTFPIKSGPLLGVIASGTVDLEDGVLTNQGTETFYAPGGPDPNAGDIVGFEINISTLTFTEVDLLGGPVDLRMTLQKGIVTQFFYSGALFNPGASLFIAFDANNNEGDVRTTGGQGEQLQSIGTPLTFTKTQ